MFYLNVMQYYNRFYLAKTIYHMHSKQILQINKKIHILMGNIGISAVKKFCFSHKKRK